MMSPQPSFFLRRNWKIGALLLTLAILVSTIFAGTQGVGPLKSLAPAPDGSSPLVSASPDTKDRNDATNVDSYTPDDYYVPSDTTPVVYPTWDDLSPDDLVPDNPNGNNNPDNSGNNNGNNDNGNGNDDSDDNTDDDSNGNNNGGNNGGSDGDPTTGPVQETVDSVEDIVENVTNDTPLAPVNDVVDQVDAAVEPVITQTDAVVMCVAELSPALKAVVNALGSLDLTKILTALKAAPLIGGQAQATAFQNCVTKVLAGGKASYSAPAPAVTEPEVSDTTPGEDTGLLTPIIGVLGVFTVGFLGL